MESNLFLRRRGSFGVVDHFVDRRGEIIDAGARHNDCIAAAMRFLSYAKELAPIVLAELNVETLSFDLQFPYLNEIIHVCKKPRSLGRLPNKRKADFLIGKPPSWRGLVNNF